MSDFLKDPDNVKAFINEIVETRNERDDFKNRFKRMMEEREERTKAHRDRLEQAIVQILYEAYRDPFLGTNAVTYLGDVAQSQARRLSEEE